MMENDGRLSFARRFSWLTAPRFALILSALVCAGHLDVIIGLSTFFFRDFLSFGYPLALFLKQSVQAGRIPLWNPHNNCGLPFLAQWNTMTFYPGSVIFEFLPLPWSLNLFVLLHQILAGAGMFCLARKLTANPMSAALAGCGFAFSGLLEHALMWPNNMAGLGWMPWLALALREVYPTRRRSVLVAIAVGSLQMMCGAPEIILFTWVVGVVLSLVEAGTLPGAGRRAVAMALVGVGVAVISAVQLLPFLDFLLHSNRHAGFGGSGWAMPLSGLANFFLPVFLMFEGAPGILAQSGQYWTSSYYVSLPILALAGGAACWTRRARVRGLALLAIGGVVLSLGGNGAVYSWLRHAGGFLGWARFPIKFVVLTTFCLPLLAAHVFTDMRRGNFPPRRRWRFLGWMAGAMALLVAGLVIFQVGQKNMRLAPLLVLGNGLERLILLGAVLGLLFLIHRRPDRRRGNALLLLGCMVLIWVDMRSHLPDFTPVVQTKALAPRPGHLRPAVRIGRSRAMVHPQALLTLSKTHFRNRELHCAFKRMGLQADCNLLDDIPKVDGFFSLYPRESFQVLSMLYRSAHIPSGMTGLLDFLAVARISDPHQPGRFVPRDSPMSWISGGQQPILGTESDVLRHLASAGFDPRRQVFLPVGATAQLAVRGPQTVTIRDVAVSAQRVCFTAEARAPALAVIAQSYYHAWQAYVDGRQTELLRANLGFQAVAIPAGTSRVQLRYEDRLFRIGGILSFVGLLIWMAAWVAERRRLARGRAGRVGR
jgi:hypothetical protein